MLLQQRRKRFQDTIHISLICLFLGVFCLIIMTARTVYSLDIALAWDRNTEPDLAGYKIFCRRKEVPSYDYTSPVWVGRDPNQTTCTVSQLDDATSYCFVARAFDVSGLESGDSNEECYSPSGVPPVEPPIPEQCDGTDNDGDGIVPADEADADRDGYRICAGDCDDGNASVYPNAAELCDGKDNDCDGDVDEGLTRVCSTACGTGTEQCQSGQWVGCTAAQPMPEVCDGIDNDCDGSVPANEMDADGDGYRICDGDCDDAQTAIFFEDFEQGTLGSAWKTTSTGTGRIQITAANGPYAGGYHLTMDSSRSGTYSRNDLVLTIDLAGRDGVMLRFYHKEFSDEDNSLPAVFTGSANGDGVAVSADGNTWHTVQGLTSREGIGSPWRMFDLDLDAAVARAGIKYSSAFRIKFQQYDNYPVTSDGFAFDDIELYRRMTDTDSDGLPDDWEVCSFGSLLEEGTGDYDVDGLSNADEYLMKTSPAVSDTDMDGIPDGWESLYGLDPLDAADAGDDPDRDGKSNIEEYRAGTDPLAASASFPFREDFESGMLGNVWTYTSTAAGRIQVTSSDGPYAGIYHVTMDSYQSGAYSSNELVLTIDLAGRDGVMLRFYHKEFSDEDNSLPAVFTGSANGDGVAVSADGVTWHTLQGLTSREGIGSSWRMFEMDLDAAVARAGISYTGTFGIKFQQYDNYYITSDGFAFDDIEVYRRITDSDSDGLPDDWEVRFFGSLSDNGTGDYDGDGLNNADEYLMKTDPTVTDSDADGMPDGWESLYGLDPLDAADKDDDPDGDGKTNIVEYRAGTDPLAASALFPFREDFESGVLGNFWTYASTAAGRIQVTLSNGPYAGICHLTMDSSRSGTYSSNELVLTIDLAGRSGVMLRFCHKEFNDEDNFLPDVFTGSANGDGVAVSSDGITWHTLQGLTSREGIGPYWRMFEADLDAAVARAGISYTRAFRIKFQQFDNYPAMSDGFAFDDIEVY